MHIFGPETAYPYSPQRAYTPPDASPEAYRRVAQTIGIQRAVVVQPSAYAQDNRRTLAALPELGMPARAVVVVAADIADRELDRMHEAGVRGIRIIATHPGSPPLSTLAMFAERLVPRRWHVQLMLRPDQLIAIEPDLARLPCPFVIDHFAGIPAEGGIGQPAFDALLRLTVRENAWFKLSAAYHCSRAAPPYDDLIPFAQAVLDRAPGRAVWGTDWPHVMFDGEMPNTTALFDRLLDWVPDADLRRRILVDNPAALYDF